MTFFTIQQIKAANKAAGHHWFEPSTMRFFASRVSGPVIGNMFVSSENDRLGGGRQYTIRRVNDDGSIDTIGEFQDYPTKAAALKALREIAKSAPVCALCNGLIYPGESTVGGRTIHERCQTERINWRAEHPTSAAYSD